MSDADVVEGGGLDPWESALAGDGEGFGGSGEYGGEAGADVVEAGEGGESGGDGVEIGEAAGEFEGLEHEGARGGGFGEVGFREQSLRVVAGLVPRLGGADSRGDAVRRRADSFLRGRNFETDGFGGGSGGDEDALGPALGKVDGPGRWTRISRSRSPCSMVTSAAAPGVRWRVQEAGVAATRTSAGALVRTQGARAASKAKGGIAGVAY